MAADPTYERTKIEANPVWKLAFFLSECLNDDAPLGWGKYIWVAEGVFSSYTLIRKPPVQSTRL